MGRGLLILSQSRNISYEKVPCENQVHLRCEKGDTSWRNF